MLVKNAVMFEEFLWGDPLSNHLSNLAYNYINNDVLETIPAIHFK